MRGFAFICLVPFLLLSVSCSVIHHPVAIVAPDGPSPETIRQLVISLATQNNQLRSFKGVGKLTVWKNGAAQTARLAWVGSDPGKLRFEARVISGQPLARFASDGEWLYFMSHPHQLLKKRSCNPSLAHLISVPVKINDILAFLAGRIPVIDHTAIRVNKNENSLVLTNGWWGGSQIIFLDEGLLTARKVEYYGCTGTLLYRVAFDKMHRVKAYTVPRHLFIENGKGEGLQLDIQKYWADAALPPSVFKLKAVERKFRKE